MSNGSDLDVGEWESSEPERGTAGAFEANSPASEVCQASHPPLHEKQPDCGLKVLHSSFGRSLPDLDSQPKEDTSDQRSMWQETVPSLECPLSLTKVGRSDASSKSLQCLVTASLLAGHHVSTEEAEPADSAIKLTDEVQQGPTYLVSDMSGHEDWSGGCGNDNAEMDECPICTELYRSVGAHRAAWLNCDHTLCEDCLSKMVSRAADQSRVRCPVCRQRTPLLRWEIQRMQEETVSSGAVMVTGVNHSDLFIDSVPSTTMALSPGYRFCAALERQLRARAESEVVCGCFQHPRWLARTLRWAQCRHHYCYMALLLALGATELSLLLLVFLPVVILVLLFTLVGR